MLVSSIERKKGPHLRRPVIIPQLSSLPHHSKLPAAAFISCPYVYRVLAGRYVGKWYLFFIIPLRSFLPLVRQPALHIEYAYTKWLWFGEGHVDVDIGGGGDGVEVQCVLFCYFG